MCRGRGEKGQALEYLRGAVEEKDSNLHWVGVSKIFEDYFGDADFIALFRDMGLQQLADRLTLGVDAIDQTETGSTDEPESRS